MGQILNLVGSIFVGPLSWLNSLFNATGMTGMFLGLFLVFQASRLLLGPLLGRRKSGDD